MLADKAGCFLYEARQEVVLVLDLGYEVGPGVTLDSTDVSP